MSKFLDNINVVGTGLFQADVLGSLGVDISNLNGTIGNSGAYWGLNSNAIAQATWAGIVGLNSSGQDSRDFLLHNPSTTAKFLFSKDGFLGIGNTTPASIFHVKSSTNKEIKFSELGDSLGILLTRGDGAFTNKIYPDTISGNELLAFDSRSGFRYFVAGLGSVGFDMIQRSNSSFSVAINSLYDVDSTLKVVCADNNLYGIKIEFPTNQPGGTSYGLHVTKSGAGVSQTNIASYFSATNGAFNYAMIVPSGGGDVGIGTSAPSSKLHIVGNGNTSATYGLKIHDSTGSSNSLVVRDDGFSGLGTSSPASTLEIFKSSNPFLNIHAGNNGDFGIVFSRNGVYDDPARIYYSGGGLFFSPANSNSYFRINPAGSTTNTTPSTDFQFEVAIIDGLVNLKPKNATVGTQLVDSATLMFGSTYWDGASERNDFRIFSNAINTAGLATLKIGTALNGGAVTTRVSITNAGDVGIGTNTPVARLDLVGGPAWTTSTWNKSINIPVNGSIKLMDPGVDIGIATYGGVFRIFTSASDVAAEVNRIIMTNSTGAVGIGTNAHASAKFDITSTTSGMLVPRMSTSERNAISSPAESLLIYNTTLSKFQYYTSAISPDGWVTIEASITGANTLQEVTDSGNTTTDDIEITDYTKGIILRSPDNSRWRITVNNAGALVTTSI